PQRAGALGSFGGAAGITRETGGRLGIHRATDARTRGSAVARTGRSVSRRTWRTIPTHGRRALVSPRAARRTCRARRPDDAHGGRDRAALSALESRSAHRR